MSKTIEEIKEEFAKGEGYENYLDLAFSGNYYAKHSDSEDTINELMVRYAQSQTQELQEQNAELMDLVERCKDVIYAYNDYRPTATGNEILQAIHDRLTKHNHLKSNTNEKIDL